MEIDTLVASLQSLDATSDGREALASVQAIVTWG